MDDRTIILADDGRFVTMGRHSVPTDEELQRATDALAAQGVGAWLATMHGTAYQRRPPRITMLRELVAPRASWETAVSKFKERHKASVQSLG